MNFKTVAEATDRAALVRDKALEIIGTAKETAALERLTSLSRVAVADATVDSVRKKDPIKDRTAKEFDDADRVFDISLTR